jgi:hypothetical protein
VWHPLGKQTTLNTLTRSASDGKSVAGKRTADWIHILIDGRAERDRIRRMKAGSATHPKHALPAVCETLELARLLAEEQGESTTKALALRLGLPMR